jgi:transposase
MYLEGLRSGRQLMRLAADRLSIRWYLGFDHDEALPDHSTLTRIREGYDLEIFLRFFDAVVERCIEAGLVWGKEFLHRRHQGPGQRRSRLNEAALRRRRAPLQPF